MIAGIISHNGASALHRRPPIADGFALRGRNVVSWPPHHPRLHDHAPAIRHRRDVIFYSTSAFPPVAFQRTVESP